MVRFISIAVYQPLNFFLFKRRIWSLKRHSKVYLGVAVFIVAVSRLKTDIIYIPS